MRHDDTPTRTDIRDNVVTGAVEAWVAPTIPGVDHIGSVLDPLAAALADLERISDEIDDIQRRGYERADPLSRVSLFTLHLQAANDGLMMATDALRQAMSDESHPGS